MVSEGEKGSSSVEMILALQSDQEAVRVFGSLDENLRIAEERFKVKIAARNHRLRISGPEKNVKEAIKFFQELRGLLRAEGGKTGHVMHKGPTTHEATDSCTFFHKGKTIHPRSPHQQEYIQAMRDYDIVISIGPAGTGKTYLAVAQAVDFLKKRRIARIILTRPAVEAGESLGFLPGDLAAKINPYLRPLYDALYDMMEFDEVAKYMQRGVIEVAPLAYMRGRTLNDCCVILDEGQNTTHEQMKMFLTRLGLSSKAVVTGDITQVDLPDAKRSGLIEGQKILKGIRGIQFVYLDEHDVVRHQLVKEIIRAYDHHEGRGKKGT